MKIRDERGAVMLRSKPLILRIALLWTKQFLPAP